MTEIAIVGLGYVGLPTALSLADHGANITGCDVSEARLADIKSGRVDLLDRDRERLGRHLAANSLKLTTEPTSLRHADAIVVCVPTPIDAHQSPDLRALSGACAAVVEQRRRRADDRGDLHHLCRMHPRTRRESFAGQGVRDW